MAEQALLHGSYARRGSSGLSLVELLIALLLGSFLSLAVSGAYLESVRNYTAELEMSRLQDNGRYALEVLKRELMLAGFLGGVAAYNTLHSEPVSLDCIVGGHWALNVAQPLDFVDNFEPGLGPVVQTASGHGLSCLNASEIAEGTDILSVKRTAGNYSLRNGKPSAAASGRSGQWYLKVENFGETTSWVYRKSSGLPASAPTPLPAVDYWAYFARIFYVRSYSQKAGDGIPTLCVEHLSGGGNRGKMSTRCMVEGVEDFQLEFGVDKNSDGRPDIFTDMPTSTEISQSVVARIYLLIRSVSEVPGAQGSRHYFLGRKQVNTDDRYLRRVISITVNLPNRALAFG